MSYNLLHIFYDMIKARPTIREEQLISSLEIFEKYCTSFKRVGEHFRSELRKDRNPSCVIDYINGDYLYTDFGEWLSLRAVDYVAYKYNLDYQDAIIKIYDENGYEHENRQGHSKGKSDSFNMVSTEEVNSYNLLYDGTFHSNGSNSYSSRPANIKIKRRTWQVQDKGYWYDRYSIHKDTLHRFNVVPIGYFWISSRRLDNQLFIADKCTYSYEFYWEDNIFRRKIYQPLSKRRKWWSNGGKVVQGEGMLPYSGDLLIITKSLKDVMTLYELGYTAVSPVSESTFLPEQYFNKQRKRFSRIVLLYDSDETGIRKSEKFSKLWNIPYILIPREPNIKDISDFVMNNSFDEAKKLMTNLL